MRSQESQTSIYINKRLGERRRAEAKTRHKKKCLKKAASTFIARRMGGVHERDQEALNMLTEELGKLLDPVHTRKRSNTIKMARMMEYCI